MAGNDGLHNQIAQQLAINAQNIVGGTASISNMRGSWPYPKTNLPPTPQTIIGPPKGRQIPASTEERLYIDFPMRVYIAKIRDASQTQHDVNEWLDAFLIGFRGSASGGNTGITLGGIVTQAVITSWNTDVFYEVQEEAYQAIDFVVSVEVERYTTYYA